MDTTNSQFTKKDWLKWLSSPKHPITFDNAKFSSNSRFNLDEATPSWTATGVIRNFAHDTQLVEIQNSQQKQRKSFLFRPFFFVLSFYLRKSPVPKKNPTKFKRPRKVAVHDCQMESV